MKVLVVFILCLAAGNCSFQEAPKTSDPYYDSYENNNINPLAIRKQSLRKQGLSGPIGVTSLLAVTAGVSVIKEE